MRTVLRSLQVMVWSCVAVMGIAQATFVAQLPGVGTGGVYDIASLANGNIVAVGAFDGTQDLDPSSAVLEFTAAENDGFVAVYSDVGELVWGGAFQASGDAGCRGVAVDGTGTIHVVGYFEGTIDADPGPGVEMLTSDDDWDIFWVRLDQLGNLQWAGSSGGTGRQFPYQLEADGLGSIVLSGNNFGTMDADPGTGELTLEQGTFIGKYDENANPQWVHRLPGVELHFGLDSGNGRVIVGTGTEVIGPGTVDFDPGPGTLDPLSGNLPNADVLVILSFDGDGELLNHHIARGFADFDGWDNRPGRIAVDNDGNAYVSGSFLDDFTAYPGNSLTLNAPSTGSDGFLIKLNSDLDLVWEKRFGAPIISESCSDVIIDELGRVWVGGSFGDGAELNSAGPSVTVTTAGSSIDAFIAAFSLEGTYLWHGTYGGPNTLPDGSPRMIYHHDQLCFGSFFRDTADLDVTEAVDLRTSAGLADAFLSCFDLGGIPTSTRDVDPVGSLEIYPSPSRTSVNVIWPTAWHDVRVRVRSIDGRVVQDLNLIGSERTTLDVSTWVSGIYLVGVEHTRGRVDRLVVVE